MYSDEIDSGYIESIEKDLDQSPDLRELLQGLETKLGERNQEILQLTQEMEKYKHLAGTDMLTGVYNRGGFDERVNGEIARVSRSGGSFSITLIDIDHFKNVNDEYGHIGGDIVLQLIGKYLKNTVRKNDVVGRYGGEEFAICLSETGGNKALGTIQRLLNGWKTFYSGQDIDELPDSVTFSAGIAEYREGDKLNDLYKRADDALYDVKNNGRDGVKF